MGLDFIYSRAKSFIRKWDRGRAELATPNLFANTVDTRPRTCTATPIPGQEFREGQEYVVSPHGDSLRLTLGTELVGLIKEPPSFLTETIRTEGASIALGRVEKVHPVSRAADLSIR